VSTLLDILAPDLVRRAVPSDILAEGIRPEWFAEPQTESDVAKVLEVARQTSTHVMPCGSGTKMTWGLPPPAGGLLLKMRGLHRVLEHAAGDMTVTVEAGCTIDELQHALAAHGLPFGQVPLWPKGQRLAVEPLWPNRATVGGVIATNDNGPLRAGYGSLRDLLLGVTVALPDGTLARSGGKVVKNVAGYDLPKLMIGAMGTLGVITRTTFRLHPVAQATRTMQFSAPSPDEAQQFVLAIHESGPPVTGLQVVAGSHDPCRVSVRLEGSSAGVHASASPVSEIAIRCALTPLTDVNDPWPLRDQAWLDAVARVTFQPTQLAALCAVRGAATGSRYWKLIAQGLGVGQLTVGDCLDEEGMEAVANLAERVREFGGTFVLLRGTAALKQRLDAEWRPDSLPLMRRVKEQFDPSRTLNPGRFGGGI
jgi:glycolate oxidase FAD binding subunit